MPNKTKGSSDYKPRPPRFPIRTKLRYRESGKEEWHDSRTINISRSGVLFDAGERIEPRTMLEMHIKIPAEFTGGEPAEISCWGPVVRAEPPEPGVVPAALAASILDYQLIQGHDEWFSRL